MSGSLDRMDGIHDLRRVLGPRKIILNCAGVLIMKENIHRYRQLVDAKYRFNYAIGTILFALCFFYASFEILVG